MIRVDLRAVWRVQVRGVERELDERFSASSRCSPAGKTHGNAGIAVRETG